MNNSWYIFMDTFSGGARKTPYNTYCIQANSQSEAERIFTDFTGEDPNDVTCKCCGKNFSVIDTESEKLSLVGLLKQPEDFNNKAAFEDYLKKERIKIIPKKNV